MENGNIIECGGFLDSLYDHWKSIREEAIANLSEREACRIIDFHGNNWIDITRWISAVYNREQQMNSVSFQFSRLFKEINWLQFLFHTSNYETGYRNLRYVLELMCQAYYIHVNYSELSLDEQVEKSRQVEENIYGWKLISYVLCDLFNKARKEARIQFKPLWDELNRHAHPSTRQMSLVAAEDFASLITDSFNTNLANKLLKVTDEVFDIIYSVMFMKYPRARKAALQYYLLYEWEGCLPNTLSVLRKKE
jgi:hypothetical protein